MIRENHWTECLIIEGRRIKAVIIITYIIKYYINVNVNIIKAVSSGY